LEAAWQTYRSQGVQLIGVNVWDGENDARRFLEEFGVTYPNGPDSSGLPIEYGLTGLPETYFIDREGQLVRHWLGPLSERQTSVLIEELLQ
jgi:cytochrome c biogenesis protein CcmG, thiol:disulfide interchange protein DsbE